MHQSRRFGVGNNVKSLDNSPHITFALSPMLGGGSLYSMPQFGHGDGGDFQFLADLSVQPPDEVKAALFALDDYIGIEIIAIDSWEASAFCALPSSRDARL